MAISLTTRSGKGSRLTHAEVDQNWTDIQTLANNNESLKQNITYTPSGTGAADRTVESRLNELKSLKDFGATGDGVTDDSTAFSNFIAAGGGYIPNGTYVVTGLTLSNEFHVICSNNATILQKPSTGNTNIFTITSGANGSSWIGGVIDGNKANQLLGDTSTPLRLNTVSDLRLEGMTIQNGVAFPALSTDCVRMNLKDLYIKDCRGVLSLARTSGGIFDNIYIDGIDNEGHTGLFQHAIDIGGSSDLIVSNITVINHGGDSSGLSSFSSGFTFNDNDRCIFSNLSYISPQSDDLFRLGISILGGLNNILDGFYIEKCRNHLELVGCRDIQVSNGIIDGNYTLTTAVTNVDSIKGITIHDSSAYSSGSKGITGPSRTRISDTYIRRCGDGIELFGTNATFDNVWSVGNNRYGLNSDGNAITSSFPNASANLVENITFNNCTFDSNGHSGIKMATIRGMTFSGGSLTNNGQDTSAGAVERSGIYFSGSSTKNNILLSGARITDTQSYTKTSAFSYNVGSTTNNRYTFTVLTPGLFRLGEYLTLNSVLTGPANATGKIVDIDRDEMVLEFSSSQTFVDSLSSGTGTISTSGTTITGSGTSFLTEMVGRVWIKANGEYRQIQSVSSDTSATLISAFSTNLSGETFQRIRATGVGVPSQQYGIYYTGSTTGMNVDNCIFSANPHKNVIAEMDSDTVLTTNTNAFAYGSEGTIFETGTYAASTITNMIGIPVGYEIIGYRWMNTTDVTGTTGSTIALDIVGGASVSLDSGLAVTKNTKSQGSVASVLLTASSQIRATFSGGSDNTPDGGDFKIEVRLRRTGFNTFDNVP